MAGVDFEALRHRVELVRETGDSGLFENRDGVPCPVCGESFEEALVTRERTRRFDPGPELRLCRVREPDRVVVLAHAGDVRSKN